MLMNDKIMLEVSLPATHKSYDLWTPIQLTVGQASALIAEILQSREPDRYSAQGDIALMDKGTGALLNPNCKIQDSGLVTGSQVVLV
ncbi:hypothetical protein KIM372_06270 [Bombiscardovia nodaiensis]|uniref:Ubiquitin-like domain-containing protein n=1 Tax=Bombiscardovia nodaiensis TaxID=2932181 RepID=A0ABM8B783_9BIFI|nr:hypothetical protein KIM372_06270 [Bombiscardovia nodaiensis]